MEIQILIIECMIHMAQFVSTHETLLKLNVN